VEGQLPVMGIESGKQEGKSLAMGIELGKQPSVKIGHYRICSLAGL
jgi:hypothetical protein